MSPLGSKHLRRGLAAAIPLLLLFFSGCMASPGLSSGVAVSATGSMDTNNPVGSNLPSSSDPFGSLLTNPSPSTDSSAATATTGSTGPSSLPNFFNSITSGVNGGTGTTATSGINLGPPNSLGSLGNSLPGSLTLSLNTNLQNLGAMSVCYQTVLGTVPQTAQLDQATYNSAVLAIFQALTKCALNTAHTTILAIPPATTAQAATASTATNGLTALMGLLTSQ